MPIVNSYYTVGHLQAEGTRYVIDTLIDHTGETHTFEYKAIEGIDYAAVLAERVIWLEELLAAQEIEELLNG